MSVKKKAVTKKKAVAKKKAITKKKTVAKKKPIRKKKAIAKKKPVTKKRRVVKKSTPRNTVRLNIGSRAANLEGRVHNAIDLLPRAAEVSENFLELASEASDPSQQAYFMGMAAYESKDFDSAREFLTQSYEMKAEAETAARLAMCSYRLTDYQSAEHWIDIALANNPNGSFRAYVLDFEVAYLSMRALIQAHLGRANHALKEAEKAIAMKPDVAAYRAASMARLATGDFRGALADLEEAFNIAPLSLKNEIASEIDLANRLREAEVLGHPMTLASRGMGAWPV